MPAGNISKRLSFLPLSLALISFWLLMFTHSAHAAGGYASPSYPDQTNSTNANGTPRATWTLNELCSTDTTRCMKGAMNYIAVYVPVAQAGTNITIRITDACDSTAADRPAGRVTYGYTATTWFSFLSLNPDKTAKGLVGALKSSDDASCATSPDIDYTFTASPTLVDKDRLIYLFVGQAIRPHPDGWSWYVNHYRLDGQNPGVLIGVLNQSLYPGVCELTTYPFSCPQTGVAYSTIDAWNASGIEWNETIAFASNCSLGSVIQGHVAIYDADHGNYQNNMRVTLEEVDRKTGAHLGWKVPPPGLLIDGGNDDTWYFPGGNNVPGGTTTIVSTSAYIANVTGVGDVNSLQVLMAGTGPAASYDCGPIPSCGNVTVFSITNAADPTVIHPGDKIGFSVPVANANGYTIGVNDIGWGNEVPSGDITNYLLTSSDKSYLRAGGPIAADGTLTFLTATKSTTNGPLAAYDMFAPNKYQHDVDFNWGLVIPGVGWATDICSGKYEVTPISPIVCGNVTPTDADVGDTLTNLVVGFSTNTDITDAQVSVTVNGAAIAPNPTVVPVPPLVGGQSATSSNITATMPGAPAQVPVTWTVSVPAVLGVSGGGGTPAPTPVTTPKGTPTPTATPKSSPPPQTGTPKATPTGATPKTTPANVKNTPTPKSAPKSTPVPSPTPVPVPFPVPSKVCTGTINVIKRPYFKVFGGDVRSGAEFVSTTGACVAGGSGILKTSGKTLSDGSWRGASTQYAAVANGIIDGFASATLRTSTPLSPTGLTFANNNLAGAPLGGNFGGVACIPNYWNDLRDPTTIKHIANNTNKNELRLIQITNLAGTPQIDIDASTNSSSGKGTSGCGEISDQTYLSSSDHCYAISAYPVVYGAPSAPNTNVAPNVVTLNHNVTTFVDGDVEILSDIKYPATLWAQPSDIPYFTMVVCGNIFIDKNVTEVDGWFIALPVKYCPATLPVANAGGNILTCTSKFNSIPDAVKATSCDNELTIRGAFTAQNIKFQRTHGGVGVAPAAENSTSTNPAEKFIFDPSFWIATPNQKALNLTTGTTKLDNFTGLPPVL